MLLVNRRAFTLLAVSCATRCTYSGPAKASPLSKAEAVALAEKFILENGYTSVEPGWFQAKVNTESLNFGLSREETLRLRKGQLSGKAIGIRSDTQRDGKPGWSVAFDYAKGDPAPTTCRVVRMHADGTDLYVQHVEGIRTYFVGFD